MALGISVVFILVTAVLPITVASPVPFTLQPLAVFPIPSGTTFNVSQADLFDYVQAAVPFYLYGPYVTLALVGGWNSTQPVCAELTRTQGGSYGPPAEFACGTDVSFTFPVSPGTWILSFGLPTNYGPSGDASVVITQTVQVVY